MVLLFGFESLKLSRIYARHLASNTASALVRINTGMKREAAELWLFRQPIVT